MKIALFSDIHANLLALKAVFADIDQQNPDQLYCLGDLVSYAPYPNEVIEEIRARRIPTIAGNHDEFIGNSPNDDGNIYQLEDGMSAGAISKALTNQLLTEANRAYLKALPQHMSIDFKFDDQQIRLLLVHGSPRKINEYLFEEHEEADLLNLMTDNQAYIMAFGHTHKPFHRVLADTEGNFRHAINIGSVGKPKDGNPHACYVILEFDDASAIREENSLNVRFIRVPYDVESVASSIEQSDFPNEYADMLRNAY